MVVLGRAGQDPVLLESDSCVSVAVSMILVLSHTCEFVLPQELELAGKPNMTVSPKVTL